ncbi:putative endonuclease/exonuclease/phosphatase family protein [Magnetofaba australis IT-1]|uniref:Putative endonuclease/exonuclease/phosphatase family protein n=1 Tax=Magnetofaba australis IT-1 TaxID=1434232 RepID=A0A1Y2K1N3_9PROT|nr:putative endonuclease/exonuclease/phosphatase family protein [Magnetofaba australis IT-1]
MAGIDPQPDVLRARHQQRLAGPTPPMGLACGRDPEQTKLAEATRMGNGDVAGFPRAPGAAIQLRMQHAPRLALLRAQHAPRPRHGPRRLRIGCAQANAGEIRAHYAARAQRQTRPRRGVAPAARPCRQGIFHWRGLRIIQRMQRHMPHDRQLFHLSLDQRLQSRQRRRIGNLPARLHKGSHPEIEPVIPQRQIRQGPDCARRIPHRAAIEQKIIIVGWGDAPGQREQAESRRAVGVSDGGIRVGGGDGRNHGGALNGGILRQPRLNRQSIMPDHGEDLPTGHKIVIGDVQTPRRAHRQGDATARQRRHARPLLAGIGVDKGDHRQGEEGGVGDDIVDLGTQQDQQNARQRGGNGGERNAHSHGVQRGTPALFAPRNQQRSQHGRRDERHRPQSDVVKQVQDGNARIGLRRRRRPLIAGGGDQAEKVLNELRAVERLQQNRQRVEQPPHCAQGEELEPVTPPAQRQQRQQDKRRRREFGRQGGGADQAGEQQVDALRLRRLRLRAQTQRADPRQQHGQQVEKTLRRAKAVEHHGVGPVNEPLRQQQQRQPHAAGSAPHQDARNIEREHAQKRRKIADAL